MADNCAPAPDMRSAGGGYTHNEELVLIQRLTAAQRAIGERVEWRIDEVVPERDGAGRYAHVAGILADVAISFDTEDGAMPGVYPGRDLFGLLTSVQMEALGGALVFIPGTFDFRRLRFDTFAREGLPWTPDPADAPDADASLTREILFDYRFGIHGPIGGRCTTKDGSIPLSWLRTRDRREDTFRAILGTPGVASLPGIGTGTSLLVFTRVNLYARIRWLERPVIDCAFRVREFTDPASERYIEPVYTSRQTRCEFAAIRHLTEDTGGIDCVDYTVITRRNGSTMDGPPASAVELMRGSNGLRREPRFATASEPADLFSSAAPGYVPIVMPKPGTKRSEEGRLPAAVTFTRATHTTSRYLVREIFSLTEEEARKGECAMSLAKESTLDPNATRDIPPALLPVDISQPVPANTAGNPNAGG